MKRERVRKDLEEVVLDIKGLEQKTWTGLQGGGEDVVDLWKHRASSVAAKLTVRREACVCVSNMERVLSVREPRIHAVPFPPQEDEPNERHCHIDGNEN